ncbi:MAG: cation:proton antiporter, partial [Pirellulaceae bacterium]
MLLCLVTLLALLTQQWTIPYPTIMVLTGLAIALVPNLPAVHLTPDIVFLIFLPPLLYAAATETPWHDFRKNLRPII